MKELFKGLAITTNKIMVIGARRSAKPAKAGLAEEGC